MVPASLKSPDGGSALDEIYRGTGLAKRSAGRPKGEFIQLKRPTIRKRAPKPSFEIVLDLGKKLGLCRRCTCPVHEADITDGYAEACDNGEWECIQAKFEDTCREYAMNHPAAVGDLSGAGTIVLFSRPRYFSREQPRKCETRMNECGNV